MKVLVTGVTGQLGYDVAKELERRHIEYKGVGSKDMNLSDPAEVERWWLTSIRTSSSTAPLIRQWTRRKTSMALPWM